MNGWFCHAETEGRPFPEKGMKKAQSNRSPSKGKKIQLRLRLTGPYVLPEKAVRNSITDLAEGLSTRPANSLAKTHAGALVRSASNCLRNSARSLLLKFCFVRSSTSTVCRSAAA